jgi:archaellum biogenesis ATPase FlaH
MDNVIDFGPAFRSSSQRIQNERSRRLEAAKGLLSFGVHYLNVALGGVAKNDLILIGAKTNKGKTELCSIIATANAMKGKHVHYFALEAEEDEIERRAKFRLLSKLVPRNRESIQRLNYLDWLYGRVDDLTRPYEESAEKAFADQFRTLHTLYRRGQFSIEDLEKQLLAVQDQTDLVIIDHLHYIDAPEENENRGYKRIVQKIRDLSLDIGKPVIVVAHVRKGDRKVNSLVPTIEDFHGTSDVPKIATKAVMIAPADDIPSEESYLWNTYVAIQKCRPDGQRTKYVAVIEFNARFGCYERSYRLGRLKNLGENWEDVDRSQWPAWANVPSESHTPAYGTPLERT